MNSAIWTSCPTQDGARIFPMPCLLYTSLLIKMKLEFGIHFGKTLLQHALWPLSCEPFLTISDLGQGINGPYSTAKRSSAVAASWPSTLAVAWPMPTEPRICVRTHSSSSTSPGTTWRLKRAFLMPPNRAMRPLYSSSHKRMTAPTWPWPR